MAISIKSFSPLQSSIASYYINSSSFKGTELMFTDANATLNCVILRKSYVYPTRYYIIQSSVLTGYSNGTNYDYRIDLGNKIKIVHDDVFLPTTISGTYAEISAPINQCQLSVYLGTNDIMADLASSITTLSNGEKYITSFPDVGNEFYGSFTFFDYSNVGSDLRMSKLYTNSIFTIEILHNTTQKLYSVGFYDSSNNIISGYGSIGMVSPSTSANKIILMQVPSNAVKVVTDSGFYAGQYVAAINKSGCATNQYLYFGNSNVINNLYCTGKREKTEEVTREYVKFSDRQRPISIKKQVLYNQNVGYSITENEIFALSTTPFVVEYNTSFGYEIYNIDNSTFEGQNTKNLADKNFVLTLKKDNEDRRYTSFSPNFYS